MCLERCFSRETDYDSDRFFPNNTGPDHVLEIREKMRELMDTIVRKFWRSEYTDKIFYTEPPEAGAPIQCQTCSLCAAVLWEKVKSLYPMSMAEFVRRVGVSKPTITNTCKKMSQIDLN